MALSQNHEEKLAEEDATHKVRVIAVTSFVVGLIGMCATGLLVDRQPRDSGKWWLPVVISLMSHTSELIGSVGLVGLLLELFGRRELTADLLNKIRGLFRIEPDFAKNLAPAMQRELVESTLIAHLGPEVGSAIFTGLVRRYFDDRGMYRENVRYQVTISEFLTDKTFSITGTTLTLPATAYFSLFAEYSFRKLFHPQAKYVAWTFGEDYTELFEMFRHREYIVREVMQIESAHRAALANLLKAKDSSIHSTFDVTLQINRKPVVQHAPKILKNGMLFEFEMPPDIAEGTSVDYDVTLSGVVARSARKFPIVISELARDPTLTFQHPPDLKVIPVHFLTGDPASPPAVTCPTRGKIQIRSESSNSWVFANSGAVFTWDL